MSKVCVFLADGFEEIEGLTVVDILRRAGIKTETVSIMGRKEIHGAHQITVTSDSLFEETDMEDADMLVLPGGMPGTLNLKEHEGLRELLTSFDKRQKHIAAICAAPSILAGLGMLEGRKACSYPSFEEQLIGAHPGDTVEVNVTFPDDYTADLAGQDAVFTVTINGIYE